MLVDLRSKGLKGNVCVESLERARITTNKNGVPFDTEKPTVTSGVRLGSPAGTTRGFGVAEFNQIGGLIADVLDGLAKKTNDNSDVERAVAEKVSALCRRFPIYPRA
jgi:glycine hydroxymethyltransferase